MTRKFAAAASALAVGLTCTLTGGCGAVEDSLSGSGGAGFTRAQLERDIRENSSSVDTGVQQQVRDVQCVETSKTTSDGQGFWLCSWRDLGDAKAYVSITEVSDGTWQSVPTATYAEASRLTKQQVERILAREQ